ncbi:tetratricopeptide repeat protein [Methylobacterium brachythecii]|uniref:Putative TPR repeat methyltransferase n=1 Tax=Methylobacterium brachythecii TaxID=1176177 RepID=A0A7W6F6U2_9HYPH|nr:tetratricopeptide repeat protein [Methylobacterium brachythecii]MBB3902391.1 putative TPR repeat methyltransferase [Methylobacterium brachythecii]GLS42239.1 hypothetical protein GCM10007884_02240 [Methylobacterium brachythecii]
MAEETELTLDEALEVAVRAHRAGDDAVAEALYQRILAVAPDHGSALTLYGLFQHGRGRHREALGLMRRAVEIEPEDSGLHLNIGNVLFEIDRPDLAVQAYEEAIRLDPRSVAARNNLGVTLRAVKLPDAAEAEYREAIAIDPAYRDTWDNLGRLLASRGRITEAIACHAKALELEPANAGTRRVLVAAYAATGEKTKAIAILRDWLRDEPASPAARHLMAAMSGDNVPDRASDQYVASLFDGFAGSFDHKLARLDYRAPALIAEAVAASHPPQAKDLDILDIGCGTGLCGPALRPYARHLVGIDLSPKMLERAAQRSCYDHLETAELTAFLQRQAQAFDLVVSADTLCYFGRLDAVFSAAAAALRPGGRFIFSVEKSADLDDFTLHGHGRYSHKQAYVVRALEEAGLRTDTLHDAALRMERGAPVEGLIIEAALSGGARKSSSTG